MIRHIIGMITGCFPVFRYIHSQKSEITTMTRPHPVICLSTKFCNSKRGRTHETNILKWLRYIQHVQRVIPVTLDSHFHARILFPVFFRDAINNSKSRTIFWFYSHQLGVHFLWNIFNHPVNGNINSFQWNFFPLIHRPKSISNIIMLIRTTLLNSCISTMIVC